MIKLKSLLLEGSKKVVVPEEPGTEHIPSNHIRLYHYTNASPETIRREGIKRAHARGSEYGEYDVVWASLTMPPRHKNYVEFSNILKLN